VIVAFSAVIIVASVVIGGYGLCEIARAVLRHFDKEKSEPSELDALVRQERINQAVPLVTMIAMNLPVDVGSITLTLHYSANEKLTMECGRPQRMEVEP
jgi:hypothetical protein